MKALNTAVLFGSSIAELELWIFSKSLAPFCMLPVRLIVAETRANLIVDGLGAGAERA